MLDIGVGCTAEVAGETRAEQCVVEHRRGGDMERTPIHEGSTAALSPVQFVHIGRIYQPSLRLWSIPQGQRDTKVWQAMHVIGGPIDRVQDPLGLPWLSW